MGTLKDLNKFAEGLPVAGNKMPLLFVGHGSPMNAIVDNEFSRGWKEMGEQLPKPKAILCISAHWETNGTFVTIMEKPKTIHDFYGFPNVLFDVQYPANGSPELAKETKELIKKVEVGFDNQWGLDHGSWSVLKHLYPDADIPVIELSIDHYKSPQWHYELAKEISSLRKKGVLILGSGNIVHNLSIMNWDDPYGIYDWAEEMNENMKMLITRNNHKDLVNYTSLGKSASLAIPTPEHYIPLLYILGLKEENEQIEFFNDKTVMGSISMTSVKVSSQSNI